VPNNEGIGVLRLQCQQMHPVGRIMKESPYQQVAFDPGASYGDRRIWPDEQDQPQFKIDCRFCNKPVGEASSSLQSKLRDLIDSMTETIKIVVLPYV
jgi:hypothetical protein